MLSPKQVAESCGLKPRAIYRAIERGELRAYRLASRLRIDPADLEAWKAENVVTVTVATKPTTVTRAANTLRHVLDSLDGGA